LRGLCRTNLAGTRASQKASSRRQTTFAAQQYRVVYRQGIQLERLTPGTE
jgi:hypothetical protein